MFTRAQDGNFPSFPFLSWFDEKLRHALNTTGCWKKPGKIIEIYFALQ
jgi:hypothetical protein